jgi:hypothetical protein
LASGRHMEELDLAVQIMRRSNLPLKGRSLPLDTAEENNKKIVPGTVLQDGLGRVARSRDDGPSLTPHFPASGFGSYFFVHVN